MIKTIFILGSIFFYSCSTLNYHKSTSDITDFELKNGIKVIFKKNTTSDVVSFRIAYRGGVYELNKDNAGVEALLMNLSLKGTKKFSKEQLNKMFFKYGLDVSPLTQSDLSIYKLKCLKKYFPIALNVLIDIVKNPLFEEKEFKEIIFIFIFQFLFK